MKIFVTLLLVTLLGLSACGKKGDPKPPANAPDGAPAPAEQMKPKA
ncbi:LPS translocon maturation chaperone LptM [Minwuia sp.]